VSSVVAAVSDVTTIERHDPSSATDAAMCTVSRTLRARGARRRAGGDVAVLVVMTTMVAGGGGPVVVREE
jgi:hypothetical protein